MRSLEASLGDHPMAMLRGIAALRGIELATNVRENVAAQLAAALAAPTATVEALASVSADAQRAWAALLAAGGQIKAPAFMRSYGAIRAIGPGKLERESTWRQPANAAEELWFRGLIFRAFADLGSGLLEYVYAPNELRNHPLPAPLAATAAPPAQPPVPVDAPEVVRQAGNSLAVDVCTLLAMAGETPWRVAREAATAETGRWRGADEAALVERAVSARGVGSATGASPAALAITLARASGWLATDRGRLTFNTQLATSWLRAPAWEQTSALFKAWRECADWNDLRRVPTLRAEGTWRNDPVIARQGVLSALTRLDPTAWYRTADLVAWIKSTTPDFQRPDGNYAGWYLRDEGSERYLSGFEAWDEVEGRLIAFMLGGPLFWLNAVMLDPGATVFRLTASGAYWLTGKGLPEAYTPAQLAVNPDFTVTAPLTAPLFDRFRLLRFTEPVTEAYSLGQPTHHRITRHSLSTARGRGLPGEKIAGFLRHATGGKVPPKVEAGLVRFDQHGGAVHINRGAVLRVEDASILAALRADPIIAPLLGELLSAQAALVKEADLPRLLAALTELGYTTKVE
jgi:hypothetical protein